MKTTQPAVVYVALIAAVLAIAPIASAQEVQITGPLAGQPAVRHLRQYRQLRFYVMPSVGYTLQDEFSRALFFGGSIGFGFTDWLGIAAWGAGAPVDIDTDLTTQVSQFGQVLDSNRVSLPSRGNFPAQIGRIRWGAALSLVFSPLRGKLSVFQAGFVDTDLYILGGIGFFGVQERADFTPTDATPAQCGPTAAVESHPDCIGTQLARADRVAFAPHFGIGLSMYFNSFVGLQLEYRLFPFQWNPSGTDEGTGSTGFPDGRIDSGDHRWTLNQMVNLGVVIYLPTEVSITE